MSNDPHASSAPQAASSYDGDDLDQDYRAAEWSYDSTAHALLEEVAAHYPADQEANGSGGHLREGGTDQPSADDWAADPHGPAAKMAPKPNMRMFGRRPEDGPRDTESKILAVSAQLQELLEQRKEEAEMGMLPVSGAQSKRTGFKPAGAPQTGSRLPVAPPISLPMRAYHPPADSGWPGLGRARSNWKQPLLYTALVLAVLAGTFWAGRASQTGRPASAVGKGPAIAVAPIAEPSVWPEASIKVLDEALAADKAGDLNGARRILGAAEAKGKALFGFRGYQANLLSRSGFAVDAEGTLAGTPDLLNPSGIEQMGFVYARNRDFDKASDWLQRAIVSNPFPAESFYRLGEALRRKGNLAEAVTRLDEALLRIPADPEFGEEREIISFKLRLAQIEGGQRAELKPELEAQLKAPAPSGYWTMTAAAASLQDGDLPAVATWLTKAKGSLGEDRFNALINDYFFRLAADRPEISWFFATTDAARKRKAHSRLAFFVDP